MNYSIFYKKSAEKELLALPKIYALKVREAINKLSYNPRPASCKKLKFAINEYRIRISDYRVIYIIKDNVLIVTIIKISHRKDVYR